MWQPAQRIRHPLPEGDWPTAEIAARSLLFSELREGKLELATRTWVPAMVPWRATEGGEVTSDVTDWYRRFAEGRPGAIVVEATGIRDVPSGPLLRIGHDRFVGGLRRLTDAIREGSRGETRVFIQLIDFLRIRRRPDREKFFSRFLELRPGHRRALVDLDGDQRWSHAQEADVRGRLAQLSDEQLSEVLDGREIESLRYGARERVTDVESEHIRDLPKVLPDLFASAAKRAVAAGFDGIELHYAHAYTMASFLSRRNDRQDGYGGSVEDRVRLPLEVLAAVKKRVGEGCAVGLRFLGDEVISGGSDLEDAMFFAEQFARAGADFISVSKGGKFEDAKQPKVGEAAYPYTGQSGYECMPTVFSDERGPFGRNLPLAAAIRRRIREAGYVTPVVGAGGIASFEQAEAALERGDADVIAAARQSLADPDWWLKMRLGHGDAVRRCEFTNYCEGLDQKHKQVTCKLWDRIDVDAADVSVDHSGKRRLVAPGWRP